MGADRVQTWTEAVEEELHPDIKGGPWTCFHGQKPRLSLTMNPESPNKGRLFVPCRQEESCKFFKWLDSEWSNCIVKHHLGEAKKGGYPNERDEEFKRSQERIKKELDQMVKETEGKVIPPLPPISDDRLKEELEKFYRRQRFVDHTKRMKNLEKQEEQWCRRLEQTCRITPELLKACSVDLNFDQMCIDIGK